MLVIKMKTANPEIHVITTKETYKGATIQFLVLVILPCPLAKKYSILWNQRPCVKPFFTGLIDLLLTHPSPPMACFDTLIKLLSLLCLILLTLLLHIGASTQTRDFDIALKAKPAGQQWINTINTSLRDANIANKNGGSWIAEPTSCVFS